MSQTTNDKILKTQAIKKRKNQDRPKDTTIANGSEIGRNIKNLS